MIRLTDSPSGHTLADHDGRLRGRRCGELDLGRLLSGGIQVETQRNMWVSCGFNDELSMVKHGKLWVFYDLGMVLEHVLPSKFGEIFDLEMG